MASILMDFWKILTLSKEPYIRVKEIDNGFSFSIRFFLVLALLASLGSLIGLGAITEQPNLADTFSQLSAQVQGMADKLPSFLSSPLDEIASTLGKISSGLTQSQPPLGKNISQAIRLVGGWLETPLNLLGIWMGAALGIWLIALLMGGQATLRQHISLLLLAFAPQILTFLNYIPSKTSLPGWLDNLLWFIAAIWSLVIGVQSLSIAHDMEKSKAFLVIIVSFLVFFVAIPLIIALVLGIILSLVF
jgi:hypothetical protein